MGAGLVLVGLGLPAPAQVPPLKDSEMKILVYHSTNTYEDGSWSSHTTPALVIKNERWLILDVGRGVWIPPNVFWPKDEAERWLRLALLSLSGQLELIHEI